jgi:hypothetical protein
VITDATCPSPDWSNRTAVASDIVNGDSRRVFTYNGGDANDVDEAPPPLPDIATVRMALWVDPNPGKGAAETQLNSGVFLRNENRRPVANCTAAATGNGFVSLNGSRSSDPEGGRLKYAWADGTISIATPGALITYQAPTVGTHTFTITVTDQGSFSSYASCEVDVL